MSDVGQQLEEEAVSMAEPEVLSHTDALTGLPGYDAFVKETEVTVDSTDAASDPLSFALVDIDWFSKVNSDYGQEVGDAILRGLSESLSASFGGLASLYRYGGDAFMAVFTKTDKEDAFLLVEKARSGFVGRQTVQRGGTDVELNVSISCGVASIPDDGSKLADIVRKCTEALYRAKVNGRSKVCLAREEKMVTKTTHYNQGQLEGLTRLAKREGMNEATLLREALDDLLRKHNS